MLESNTYCKDNYYYILTINLSLQRDDNETTTYYHFKFYNDTLNEYESYRLFDDGTHTLMCLDKIDLERINDICEFVRGFYNIYD